RVTGVFNDGAHPRLPGLCKGRPYLNGGAGRQRIEQLGHEIGRWRHHSRVIAHGNARPRVESLETQIASDGLIKPKQITPLELPAQPLESGFARSARDEA